MSPSLGAKPTVHLICNAHLDPVWQWRWEEGASEALATFRNAVDILDENPELVFCHNEAVLYQWAERYDPGLFADIRRLVESGRWAIAGGWFIQPDLNLPGTESLIRQIAGGRRYFRERFGVVPRVAYNFDSFGHGAGLPQILRRSGYEMYVHMRPQSQDLTLPADLYRWRGTDGTVIPAYRISVGLYHTERDNIAERLAAAVELALVVGRDVPVFWGLGNHGGGATRADLGKIDAFRKKERRVRILHSTPDGFYQAVRDAAESAPAFEGGLQRCFTGCYTSLSRLKRRSRQSLGSLVQSETMAAAAWWLDEARYPAGELRDAWRAHLFNDFHDIITGSCVEPAEKDALDAYGCAETVARGLRLAAAAALSGGQAKSPALPVTVVNTVPSPGPVPVEFECMADYRPFWKGRWRLCLFRADGREIPSQEEPAEPLLPFNDWRRRLSFIDTLPGVGVSRYFVRALEVSGVGSAGRGSHAPRVARPRPAGHRIDRATGVVVSLKAAGLGECLAGPLFEPLVVRDLADSWGTGVWSYRDVTGTFRPEGPPRVLFSGPVRRLVRSVFVFGRSRIVQDVYAYPDWPVLDVRLRVTWNEARRRLKLRVPTRLASAGVLFEVPGSSDTAAADGEERVHGRWLMVAGTIGGREAALGIVNNGQPGFDFKDAEVRLSVLRSVAYCHEQGFDIDGLRAPGFTDIGVHHVRLLVTAGDPDRVRAMLPALADLVDAPPAAYAHLPFGVRSKATELLSLFAPGVRLLACKQSWDGQALIVRLQEASGRAALGLLRVAKPGRPSSSPRTPLPLSFRPFELKTLRIERAGDVRDVALIEER